MMSHNILTKANCCAFCNGKNLGISEVKKSKNSTNKVYAIYCKECGAKGPKTSTSKELAVELWNTRIFGKYEPQFKVDEQQLKRFIDGEILLLCQTQQQFNTVLKSCKSVIENCDTTMWYLWGNYEEHTVVDCRSSTVDKDKPWFGYGSEQYFRNESKLPIEVVEIIHN